MNVELYIIFYSKSSKELTMGYFSIEEKNRYCSAYCIMKDSVIYKSNNREKVQKIFDYIKSHEDKDILREHNLKIKKLEDDFKKKQRQLFEKSFNEYITKYPEMFLL